MVMPQHTGSFIEPTAKVLTCVMSDGVKEDNSVKYVKYKKYDVRFIRV